MDKTETLDILYHDQWLIAVHKPAGLLVHKSPIDKHETRYAMRLLRDQIGQWVYPVHRLDKPTSGLLLFALDSQTASLLGKQFEQQQVSKLYQAVVRGYTQDLGLVDHPLKEIAAFKSQQAQAEQKEEKTAQTHYRSLIRYELPYSDGRFDTSRYSLLEMTPVSGRKHQIRRHLKHISHPIVGDVKYGKGPHNRLFRDQFKCSRLLLACTSMQIIHPYNELPLHMTCPLADDFVQTLHALSTYKKPD
ncbi:MAG: pseudouridylate synthase [Oleiphilus sp.]|nr:MAG: pseudouridylate synthase [Oleiphilus sp.]